MHDTRHYDDRGTLPIFAYGTLQGEALRDLTGVATRSLGRFTCRGLSVGMGDLYPCADITYQMGDVAEGEGIAFRESSSATLYRVDEYEGVADGYYQRHIIFVSPESEDNLFVPMWAYTRGDKLQL